MIVQILEERKSYQGSIRRIVLCTCDWCKVEFVVKCSPSRFEKGVKFCSHSCASQKAALQTNKRIDVQCEMCKEIVSKRCTRVFKRNYCSRICFEQWMQLPNEEKNPERYCNVVCFFCKTQFLRTKTSLRKRNFCSDICRKSSQSIMHQLHDVKSSQRAGIKQGYYIARDGRKFRYDSSYELKRMKFLDLNLDVEFWARCDFTIEWKDEEGRSHQYNPDFFVRFRTGKVVIEEVKGYIGAVDHLKFAAGEKFCEHAGWTYRVLRKEDLET